MIVNSSYFIGDLYLSQIGGETSEFSQTKDEFNYFIDKYEYEILNLGLGVELYNDFVSNLQPDGTLIVGADEKWNKLLNGTSYEKNGVNYFWRGLIQQIGVCKLSLIAYYIYYKYISFQQTQHTSLGLVSADAENSIKASAIPKMTKAWRNMLEWYGDVNYNYGLSVKNVGGIVFYDYFNEENNSKQVSLYNFLNDNVNDYSSFVFTPICNKNNFGI